MSGPTIRFWRWSGIDWFFAVTIAIELCATVLFLVHYG